ncbi:glycosyltransferase [Selenomonas sp. AB3002]|uniref:glycosyltransferase n=1 Tax=Selenomonas sp. AB3002 TaxID=1392502 RepID=UPI0004960A3E
MPKECLLSLALIMRDAAEEILVCLSSVAQAVDEMVIVDTGSVDDSVKIVRRFLRKWQQEVPGRRGKLYDFVWQDDFSLAKNYALSRCHGEFVLFLDSDESLSEGTRENLRPLAESLSAGDIPSGVRLVAVPGQAVHERKIDLLEIWRENVDLDGTPVAGEADDLAVRLLRRQELLRYRGEVHEQLVLTDGRQTKIAAAAKGLLSIRHTGYRPEVKAQKNRRNEEILLKEERQGGSTFLLDYYLAETHLSRREWREAIECAQRSFGSTLPVHDRVAPYRIIYQALRELEQEACSQAGLEIAEGEPLPEPGDRDNEHLQAARSLRQQGEAVLAKAMSAFPDYPDFYYFRGGRRWNAGDKPGGKADLERALLLAEAFPAAHPEADFRFKELLPSLRAVLEQVRKEAET